VEFRVLGPLEVVAGGQPLDLGTPRQRALLGLLLVHAGEVVSYDRLLDDLWDGDPPATARHTLQGYVHRLRRTLGADAWRLITRPPGYQLKVSAGELDAQRFQDLATAGRRALVRDDPQAAADQLAAGLGLWRGPLLADLDEVAVLEPERARLEALRLTALEDRIEADLALGGHGGLVAELEALLADHPYRERLWGQLMLALYRSGRQADALEVYQATRAVLAEELGIDPSPGLQRLQQAILVQDPALEAATPRQQPRHNLPERLTSLVGRSEELREAAKLVEQHRLVTVTGPGGAGKTSLAVELARRLAAGYPDGVWLAELAALRDPALLGEVVAVTLGLGEEPAGPGVAPPAVTERLASFVADKGLLLVLDNCEHLVEACAGLARRLLQAGPAVRVLATSREVLGVPGEVVWPVPPWPSPA
jgi:DNA-binding SARP family transcriptional activator